MAKSALFRAKYSFSASLIRPWFSNFLPNVSSSSLKPDKVGLFFKSSWAFSQLPVTRWTNQNERRAKSRETACLNARTYPFPSRVEWLLCACHIPCKVSLQFWSRSRFWNVRPSELHIWSLMSCLQSPWYEKMFKNIRFFIYKKSILIYVYMNQENFERRLNTVS